MKLCTFFLATLTIVCMALGAADIEGFWKTVDDKTHKVRSIVGIYTYQGKYYGRIVATLDDEEKIHDTLNNPQEHAPGIEGEPFYSGLDLIYELQDDGTQQYKGGKIVDPDEGKVYNAHLWVQDGKLIVRGEVLVFGKSQEWIPATDADFTPAFPKPDMSKFVPHIPVAKKMHRLN